MKTESLHDGLFIKPLIREETYSAPCCIFPPGVLAAGCSSVPLAYPGSIIATCGKVPFAASVRNCEAGTMFCRPGPCAYVNMLNRVPPSANPPLEGASLEEM